MSFFSQPLPRWLWLPEADHQISREPLKVKDWRKFFRETSLWPEDSFPGENSNAEQNTWLEPNINRRRLFCQWCRFKTGEAYALDDRGFLHKGLPFHTNAPILAWDQAAMSQLLNNGAWQEVLSSLRDELQKQTENLLPGAFYKLASQAYSGMGERKTSLRLAILGVFAEDDGADHGELVKKVEVLF